MKKYPKLTLCVLAAVISSVALADDADQVLDRQKTMNTMVYKRDQLKLQADMAEAYKKMSDAGFIVDSDGNPVGVETIQKLGVEVRTKARGPDANPFQSPGSPIVPNAMPFMLDQPTMSGATPATPSSPFGQQQRMQMPGGPGAGLQQPQPQVQPASEDDEKKVLALKQVRGDSVILTTSDGDRVVRAGEKVYDLKLVRFSVDKAYLKGPKGTQVLSIDWTNSKRYADD
ncbi:hypothetical protein [Pseudomonas mosselii]|uniref:hypothetical protein n=1 Tax=Pseudomonas mosselii TaxID=78327 RepID=UPI0021DB30F7|nr:hypothetical protein [Pseudomonas mosselii]MCU9528115.1 hypothetical protein [Pseudomonas mosselii]MCU9535223.1 hypothetical protein [Pseudomonas mosselii]MCU9542955.1 hypothetical protein [Pseudomonas mosselii]MCU9546959.1 hypothetical protein [Pseudomonas mosselii]